MASYSIHLDDREVRIETLHDKKYHVDDDGFLQLSAGIPGSTGWAVLSRSQALMVADVLTAMAWEMPD